jgi:hypothetical protein
VFKAGQTEPNNWLGQTVQQVKEFSTRTPAHLLAKSPKCGRADCRIRTIALWSCRRKSHLSGPSPVDWKDQRVQQNVPWLVWPRCLSRNRPSPISDGEMRKQKHYRLKQPNNIHMPENRTHIRVAARFVRGSVNSDPRNRDVQPETLPASSGVGLRQR